MRHFLIFLLVFVMGIGFSIPIRSNAATIEPENSFCIYGIPGMYINISDGNSSIEHTFGSNASHFNDPYIVTESQIRQWYSDGVNTIHIIAGSSCAATFTTPNSIISAIAPDGVSGTSVEIFISSDDGLPLSFTTKLLALKRMYLFPTGTLPQVAGVEPTPFVNDGEEIVVGDTDIKSTIGAVDDFQPFIQFIFSTVIPWASVAGVVILVLATIKFMLKG